MYKQSLKELSMNTLLPVSELLSIVVFAAAIVTMAVRAAPRRQPVRIRPVRIRTVNKRR